MAPEHAGPSIVWSYAPDDDPADRTRSPFLSLLLLVAPLTGCDRGPRASETTRTDSEFTLPPPAAAETSRFSVPLDYDFSAILRVVERVVPKTLAR